MTMMWHRRGALTGCLVWILWRWSDGLSDRHWGVGYKVSVGQMCQRRHHMILLKLEFHS